MYLRWQVQAREKERMPLPTRNPLLRYSYYSPLPDSTSLEPTTPSTVALGLKFNTSWTEDKYSNHSRCKDLPTLTICVTSSSHLVFSFSHTCITKWPHTTYDFLGLKGDVPIPFRTLPIPDSIIVKRRWATWLANSYLTIAVLGFWKN